MKLKYKPLMPQCVTRNADTGNSVKDWIMKFAANCNAFRALLREIENPRCSVKSIRKFTKVLKENTALFEVYEFHGWTNAEREQMDQLLEAFREIRNRGIDRLAELIASR